MARIRTVKPEFWTDEKIVQLPFEARLLFIGLWNFADDDGFLLYEPSRVKLQILPADEVDAGLLLDLLVAAEILECIDLVDGETLLSIPSFPKHQKISHKTPTRFGLTGAKKRSIPNSVRREVAIKYGCKPGGEKTAECYYCGVPGSMKWWNLANGRPSSWVSFGDLELDHFVPESSGGITAEKNLVLSCRYCNRSKKNHAGVEFILKTSGILPEDSGSFPLEGNGREGKGRDKDSVEASPLPDWINASAWAEWVKYRKEIRKPLTKTSITKQLKLLEANKADHVEILNQSMQNGWTGLFPLKGKTHEAHRGNSAVDRVERANEKYRGE